MQAITHLPRSDGSFIKAKYKLDNKINLSI